MPFSCIPPILETCSHAFDADFLHKSAAKELLKLCLASQITPRLGVNMYNWPVSAERAALKHTELQKVVMEKDAALKGFNDFMRSEAQDLLTPPSALIHSL